MTLKTIPAMLLIAVFSFEISVKPQVVLNHTTNDRITPELKEKAFGVLSKEARETSALGASENRVGRQITLAALLFEKNENEARSLFQNARTELSKLLASVNVPGGTDKMTRAERAEHYAKRDVLAALRRALVLSLAEHDTELAIAAFNEMKVKTIDEYDPLVPDELELQLAAFIASKAPEKTLAIAKQQFVVNGLSYQFTESIKEIHKRDSQAAANIAKQVLAKAKSSKIRVPSETDKTAYPANSAEIDFWQLTHFINTASELNRAAFRDKEGKTQPLFSDAEMKELVELIAAAFLSTRNPAVLAIGHVMTEIARFAPDMAEQIRAKIGDVNAREIDNIVRNEKIQHCAK